MALTDAALLAELQNDPTAIGYAALLSAGKYGEVVAALNLPRGGVTVGRTLIPSWEFINALAPAEYILLTQAQRDYLMLVACAGQVQLGGGGVRDALTALFGPATTSRANLIALLNRQASRAEFLFGQAVTIEDCVRAIRGSF